MSFADDRCDINSDLRTDAVPDVPRESITKENNLCDNSNEAVHKDAVQEEPRPLEPKPTAENLSSKPQTSSKPKKKTSRNKEPSLHQGATIFNISGSNGIHIGNSFTIQCNNGTSTFPKSPTADGKEVTKEIKKLLKSSDPITVDDIDMVSSHVGILWMDVGRHLKYSDGQLEQFQEDNGRKGLKEVVYQLLLDWKQVNTSKATVGLLCTALWMSKQYDAVEVLMKKATK